MLLSKAKKLFKSTKFSKAKKLFKATKLLKTKKPCMAEKLFTVTELNEATKTNQKQQAHLDLPVFTCEQ